MKAVVAAFNQEKALVGAFSVITNLRMELFGALVRGEGADTGGGAAGVCDKTRASEDHQPAAAARARAGARASEARAEM